MNKHLKIRTLKKQRGRGRFFKKGDEPLACLPGPLKRFKTRLKRMLLFKYINHT